MCPQKTINKSAFFKLESKSKLAQILFVSLEDINLMISEKKADPKKHYRVFSIKEKVEKKDDLTGVKTITIKKRDVEEPRDKLKQIHSRIKNLLAVIETPDYLISGKAGKSIVDNAKPHLGNPFIICADIQSFYKNVSREAVLQLFLHKFKTSPDIAYILTELVIYNDIETGKTFVPTGSPSSQIIAYWAYSQTFDDIYNEAKRQDIVFSLYVDDLTFSCKQKMPPSFLKNIIKRLRAVGLDINHKKNKIKKYGPNSSKILTGNCITTDNKLMPKNKLMHSIKKIMAEKRIENLTLQEVRRLMGKIIAARQQCPNLFENIYPRVKATLRSRLKEQPSSTMPREQA